LRYSTFPRFSAFAQYSANQLFFIQFLPVGDLSYTQNYFANTLEFFGPELCKNESYIPAYPVNMSFINNVPTTSASQVPSWILEQAGVQP